MRVDARMPSPRTFGSLSGLEFRVLSRELSSALSGTYVSNIYSIGESQLLRMKRPSGEEDSRDEVSLVLSPKLGAWVTRSPVRVETTEFTSRLRSYLLRARLVSVSQLDLDRVLSLKFRGKGEDSSYDLILEMMPPGNLVLTDGKGDVALALREVRSESRRVVKGQRYLPPAQGKVSIESLTLDELGRALSGERTVGRALGRSLSIPRRYVEEILARTSHAQADSSALSQEEAERLYGAIRGLAEGLERPAPSLVKSEDGTLEVMVTKPQKLEVIERAQDLSTLLDKVLLPQLLAGEEKAPRTGGDEAEAHERRVQEYKATLAGLESKRQAFARLSAELRELAPRARAAVDGEEAAGIAKGTKLLPADLAEALPNLAEKGPASVSSAIFDRAKKADAQAREVEEAIKGVEAKLKRESGKVEAKRPRTVSLARAKKDWYEKFRWFFTTGGKLAIGGRDAQSNTALIRRHVEASDTVYHADLFGSPFFVLKGGRDQTDEEVKEVAKATVTFSSAWKTGLGAADAYWVEPSQVGAAGPSGEYLAHGSFAIKGKKNFVNKNPVEVSVGVDESGRVVSGPEEAVMRMAKAHVAVIPSRDKPSDTAKKIAHELGAYLDPGVKVTVDDVLRMLPAGGGKVVRRRVDKK